MGTGVTVADLTRVLDAYEAIRRRDLESLMGLLGESPVVQTRVETHDGANAVRRMFAEAFASEFAHEQEALLIDGATIVVLSRIQLVGPSTGIQTQEQIVEAWSFDESGRINMRVLDREEGLREAGLEDRATRVAEVYRAFEALNSGDFEGASELLADDVELHRGTLSLETEVLRGVGELQRQAEPDAFESQRMEPQQVIDAGDRALITYVFRARGAGSGIELANRAFQVATLREGKAVRLDLFQERDEALAMLLEPDA